MYLPMNFFKDVPKDVALDRMKQCINIQNLSLGLIGLQLKDGTFEIKDDTDSMYTIYFQNSDVELSEDQRELYNKLQGLCLKQYNDMVKEGTNAT